MNERKSIFGLLNEFIPIEWTVQHFVMCSQYIYLLLKSYFVLFLQILRSMLYRGSEIMREVAWVIFDEIHYMRDKGNTVKPDETGHWVNRNPVHSNLNFKSPVFSLIFFVKNHLINRTLHIPKYGLDLRSQYTNYCYNLSP